MLDFDDCTAITNPFFIRVSVLAMLDFDTKWIKEEFSKDEVSVLAMLDFDVAAQKAKELAEKRLSPRYVGFRPVANFLLIPFYLRKSHKIYPNIKLIARRSLIPENSWMSDDRQF